MPKAAEFTVLSSFEKIIQIQNFDIKNIVIQDLALAIPHNQVQFRNLSNPTISNPTVRPYTKSHL